MLIKLKFNIYHIVGMFDGMNVCGEFTLFKCLAKKCGE